MRTRSSATRSLTPSPIAQPFALSSSEVILRRPLLLLLLLLLVLGRGHEPARLDLDVVEAVAKGDRVLTVLLVIVVVVAKGEAAPLAPPYRRSVVHRRCRCGEAQHARAHGGGRAPGGTAAKVTQSAETNEHKECHQRLFLQLLEAVRVRAALPPAALIGDIPALCRVVTALVRVG